MPRRWKSSSMLTRSRKLRASRSGFQTISVSPSCNCFETTEQGRALGFFSGSLVLKNFLASGFFQGGELQGRILVHGRDAGVAVFHALLLAFNLKHQT